jgi:hypothetical protein
MEERGKKKGGKRGRKEERRKEEKRDILKSSHRKCEFTRING